MFANVTFTIRTNNFQQFGSFCNFASSNNSLFAARESPCPTSMEATHLMTSLSWAGMTRTEKEESRPVLSVTTDVFLTVGAGALDIYFILRYNRNRSREGVSGVRCQVSGVRCGAN